MINEYLNDHSLKEDFVQSLGWVLEDERIIIPIYDIKGKLLFCRYRNFNSTSKFTSDKGAHPALYCIHKATKHENIVLCEGEPDCARLWQENIPAVTGTGGVKTFSSVLAAPLANKTIILCLDTDDAGQSSIEKYIETLHEVGAKTLIKILPSKYKDISEYFTAGFTKEDFLQLPIYTYDEWKDATAPEEFAFETLLELNKQEIPEEEWIVNRIMPKDGFTFIIGAEATGKSFYTLTLAKSISTGTAWLEETAIGDDNLPLFTTKKANVLIIDKENTKRRVLSRIRWLEMQNIDNIFYLKYPHFFELGDPKEDDGLSKFAKEVSRKVQKYNIDCIFIDSFTDVMLGNENAASDTQGFFDAMRRLFPNKAILVLHHASKPAPGVVRTSAQRARGSTNIMAQVYSAFYVEALPKSRTEFVWEQTKAGDAQKLPRFTVELDVQPIEGSQDKTKVAGIIYKGIVLDEEMKADQAVTNIENIFKKHYKLSRQELLEILQNEGINQRTALRAITDLKNMGFIKSVVNEHSKAKRDYVWTGHNQEEINQDNTPIFYEED